MQLYYFYIASAVLIALGYMLFDVLNKREVPNLFAYSTLVFAFAMALLYGNELLTVKSYLIAFIVLGLGYFIYKIGQLGLGDVLEFATLSLLLAPIMPVLTGPVSLPQLPAIVSLFLDTGIAAIVAVPAFYICIAWRRMGGRKLVSEVRRNDLIKMGVIILAYLLFVAFLSRISSATALLFTMMFVIILGSALLLLFQRPITEIMIERVGYQGFVEDDIIAFNLMTEKQIASAKKRVRSFDRLVTSKMIAEMKTKGIKERFPVYKRAIPFAVPIFIGTILTILVGNILLAVLLA